MINAVCNSPSWSSPSRESPAGAFEPWHSPEGSLRDDILPRGTLRHACPHREIVRNDLSGMVFSLMRLSIVKLSGMDALSQSSPSWDSPTWTPHYELWPHLQALQKAESSTLLHAGGALIDAKPVSVEAPGHPKSTQNRSGDSFGMP